MKHHKQSKNAEQHPILLAYKPSLGVMFMRLFMLVCLLNVTHSTWADDFLQNVNNYTCTQVINGVFRFTLPTQNDLSTNEGVESGRIDISVEDGSLQRVLEWRCDDYSDLDAGYWIRAFSNGTFQLNGTATVHQKFKMDDLWVKYYLGSDQDDSDHRTTTVDWLLPYEFRGKKVKVYVWAHVNHRLAGDWHVPSARESHLMLECTTDPAEETRVDMSEWSLAFDQEHVGQLMAVYSIPAKTINSLTFNYTDIATKQTYKEILSSKKIADKVYLPMQRAYENIFIDGYVTDMEGNDIYVKSAPVSNSVVHIPCNLSVDVLTNGTAKLTWNVENPLVNDVDDFDNFEILYNTTATVNENEWRSLGSVEFVPGQVSYSFIHEDALTNFEGANFSYRVRRTSTGIWRWAEGSGFEQRTSSSKFALPYYENAKVSRGSQWNDESHKIDVSFEQRSPNYDNEGHFIVRNDSCLKELDQLIAQGKFNYEQVVFVISSLSDWERLAQQVAAGHTTMNAELTNSIDLTNTKWMIGSDAQPFKGSFNGNGFTLTFNYNTTEPITAPFRVVGGATIKNLIVAGTVSSSSTHAAGLIGNAVAGTNVVENCWVSATINSSIDGAAHLGGYAGKVTGGILQITNCRFDGSLTGENNKDNAGFIGRIFKGGKAELNSCLFTPRLVNTNHAGCSNFANSEESSLLTVTNCYSTYYYNDICVNQADEYYYFVIHSENDWRTFRDNVEKAKAETFMCAVLDADISVKDAIGSPDKSFYGIFDGNGHTLNVSIDKNELYMAPFWNVRSGSIIRNLNVTGVVKGGKHASGLVGGSYENGTLQSKKSVTIENVRVSAEIITTDDYAGGIVGHGHQTDHTINNCLFDGKISRQNGGGHTAAAIIGWEDGGTTNRVTNCVERGFYGTFANVGFCVVRDTRYGNNVNCVNNYSSHNWGEMGDDAHRNIGNLTADQLLQKLNTSGNNDQWLVKDNLVVPKAHTFVFNGVSYETQSVLAEKLKWPENTVAIPEMKSSDHHYDLATWDSRAKMYLRIHMQGENKTETNTVQVSDIEEAVKNLKFSQELTRKCVEYSFDLMVVRNVSPLKFQYSDKDTLIIPVVKIDEGELANYRFANSDTLRTLTAATKQSAVELTWTTSGGDHDYFMVLRKDILNQEAKWDTISRNVTNLSYIDETVLPHHSYLYRVESVYQCEGTNKSAIETTGSCASTGMVNGYVRMSDGTALAGVVVKCRPDKEKLKGSIPDAKEEYTTITDSLGYYEFRDLPYQLYTEKNDSTNGCYIIVVESLGDAGKFEGPNANGSVIFNGNSNWTKGFNFYLNTYYIYSGNVYYRDTSIPVSGVRFKLDNVLMHDASGNTIETDTQGAFSLTIPKGSHKVQAVKDGHYFANDGCLTNPDAHSKDSIYYVNFNKNISNVFLWDSTKVVLRGRVVGGDRQGQLPLGRSLSVNNLGDSLKIVMQLEGDNASYLIRKQDDETVKSASYQVQFGYNKEDVTNVYTTRHSITIRPDSKTGEFQLYLNPAKYKITEISAQGYATLFMKGQVGQTLDLSFNVQGDTVDYKHIYHSMPDVEVTQFNTGNDTYYGIKSYISQNNIGQKDTLAIWYKDQNGVGQYAFGYPVFMSQTPYAFLLQACEKYYWNNNYRAVPDIVMLKSGKITFKNALTTDSKTSECTIELDSLGKGQYIFTPDNATFVLEGDNALKYCSITLEYDDNFYDIKPFYGEPLKAFVMAYKPKKEGKYTIAAGRPVLADILRDPPGGGSSAYLEAGSRLSTAYNLSLDVTVGASFSQKTIKSYTTVFNGAYVGVPGGQVSGTVDNAQSQTDFSVDVATSFNGSWNWAYNYDISERIQTKSSQKWVGGKADLFIGHNENILMTDALAVRAISEEQYQLVKNNEGGSFQITDKEGNVTTVKVPVGMMKVLAKGVDNTGKTIYLVRDEVIAMGPKVASTFVYSQNYIENELLPGLTKIRNSLIHPMGTTGLQELADQNQKTYYLSLVPTDDVRFGDHGTYTPIYPKDNKLATDTISNLNTEIVYWLHFLAYNEMEKVSVTPDRLVKNYDFDGAANIQYSENFQTAYTRGGQLKYPLIQSNDLMKLFPSIVEKVGLLQKFFGNIDKYTDTQTNPKKASINNEGELVVAVGGSGFKLTAAPILNYSINGKNTLSDTNYKKVGFTLATSAKSSMNIDVYRTKKNYWDISTEPDTVNNIGVDNFLTETAKNLWHQHTGNTYQPNYKDWTVYSSFVYRTRAGITCEPYEKERVTKWYQPGTVIDVATIPVDKPRIWIDEPVVSNVPFDEPARFTLHMANETNYPDRASLAFNYYLLASSNPKGAKVCVDGKVLSSGGENITLWPAIGSDGKHTIFTKEITVYPSEAYDYENLTICLYDPDDSQRVFEVSFSAHFIPTAGKVNISMPSNNWVINTESPYDSKRKAWYMPVRIDGFNTTLRGFDHVELQYKLSNRGDNDWVSVCSYYANDSLRSKASGVTDSIPRSGTIVAPFYGETDPVEQYYDIRAVVYARHGSGFLTSSSAVIKGIKDTRLPVVYGTPEPTNGILGIGDDIKIKFSEPIADNYLRNVNNFEVLGTLNNKDISTSTSLSFNGTAMAFTQGERNLANKDFSVDVMVNPAEKSRMGIFSHGGQEKGLCFGLTEENRLFACINNKTVESDSVVSFSGTLHEVVYTVEHRDEDMEVGFWDGSKKIGTKTINGRYDNMAKLIIGQGNDNSKSFKGEMREFRLWNSALGAGSIEEYGKKKLTGYEFGLLDYYPMDEGDNNWAYDKAPASMDLVLVGTNWKRPAGISVAMKGDKGLLLNKEKFVRNKKHDYTLMFWFSTNEKQAATLFSNGEAKYGQTDQLNIGIKDSTTLTIRSSGYERKIENLLLTDGSWNHFTMTVSRSQNVANIYLNKKLVDSFAADSLSGIESDHIALGATYVDKNTPTLPLTGYMDEVGMFSSVLPYNLIKEYSNQTPLGTTSALMAYLDFGRSEKQDDNTQKLVPTGISIKRYVDSQGKVLAIRDTLVANNEVEAVAARNTYAPMYSNAQFDNLNYSFVADGKELLINITEPDFMIEKTNLYVTVKDVSDLQGNLMASPITLNLYAKRNPLCWNVTKIEQYINYGSGAKFTATISNRSGMTQNFRIVDLPIWITCSQTEGTINRLDEVEIEFTVSSFINVGTYNEQITLEGDNKMSEPLPITLNVRDDIPDIAVNPVLKQLNQTMMMVAQVKIDGVISTSSEDILIVRNEKGQTMGVANIEVNNTSNANESLTYITIYGYSNSDNSKIPLVFNFYDASSGNIYNLTGNTTYYFEKDATIGNASNPVVLTNSDKDIQIVKLKKGWNWVSFEVLPNSNTTVGQFLNSLSNWEAGDKISTVDGRDIQEWTCRKNLKAPLGYTWDHENDTIKMKPHLMYNIYSMSDKTIFLEGDYAYGVIVVHQGWNRIGYLSHINLPIAQAFSGYIEQASEGDIVKSQDAFAVASKSSTGNGLIWKGSLQFLEKGKGYMMKRQSTQDAAFYYPLYWHSHYNSNTMNSNAPLLRAPVATKTTMNIVACVEGVTPMDGDRLVVYCGAERMAEATADEEGRYYLNIGSDSPANGNFVFAIERGEETIALTNSQIHYSPNLLIGTPDVPTAINFTAIDELPSDGHWYTLGGVRLKKKPTETGHYIYNGKVKFVKK